MLLPCQSDPVLIKPSHSEFLRSWCEDDDMYGYSNSPQDSLYGIFITLTETNMLGYPGLSKEEKEKQQRKFEYQMKRRNSVILANINADSQPGNLKRSWSCVDLPLRCEDRDPAPCKRVSFSINAHDPERVFEPSPYLSNKARPILVRKRAPTGKETLSHMDFDSFIAWRRGSRLGDDVAPRRRYEANGKTQDQNSNTLGECWLIRVIKYGFESCLKKRRVNPTESGEKKLETEATNPA